MFSHRFGIRNAAESLSRGVTKSKFRLFRASNQCLSSALTRDIALHRFFATKPSSPISHLSSLNFIKYTNRKLTIPIQTISKSKPIIGYWYLFTSSLVFGIVIIGGLTRLTESGLSITEWNLIKGMKYPTTPEAWSLQFQKYKSTPEYTQLNHSISLQDFQFIYFMEWAHRMWGRLIGVCFIAPGVVFAARGYMTPAVQRRTLIVSGLIGCQGLLGWYMVKSGLSEEHIKERPVSVPRVSQYRLAAHLGSAFLIYSIMLDTGLAILEENRVKALPAIQDIMNSGKLRYFRKYAMGISGLVFLTAISGAFVAGLDAGLVYNEFPKMGNGYIPTDMWALSEGQNGSERISWYMNLLENPAAVQFNHRILGVSTATAVAALWIYSRRVVLPRNARIAVNALLGVAAMQVTLGISTLIYFVPVPLAAAHQSGSLTLLSVAIWLMHTLKRIPK